jgi:hypothetical protein
LSNKKIPAGTMMPPSATQCGQEAFFIIDNSLPYTFPPNSKPIKRKKMAINPSLIHSVME